jgi:hypothetical protein
LRFAPGEARFTLVMWDQRGEGKTFARSCTSVKDTMTIDQMTKGGIEVTEYLRTPAQRHGRPARSFLGLDTWHAHNATAEQQLGHSGSIVTAAALGALAFGIAFSPVAATDVLRHCLRWSAI